MLDIRVTVVPSPTKELTVIYLIMSLTGLLALIVLPFLPTNGAHRGRRRYGPKGKHNPRAIVRPRFELESDEVAM